MMTYASVMVSERKSGCRISGSCEKNQRRMNTDTAGGLTIQWLSEKENSMAKQVGLEVLLWSCSVVDEYEKTNWAITRRG
jgi:hypothetical protein